MKLKVRIKFAEQKTKEAFEELRNSKEEAWLYKAILYAINEIEENSFCGIQIQKNLVPKEYIRKYCVDNCWKMNLPKGWRILYSIQRNDLIIMAIVLEWLTHKEYERKFGY